MAREPSYVGPGILRFVRTGPTRKRVVFSHKVPIAATIVVAVLLLSMLVFVEVSPKNNGTGRTLAVNTIPILLQSQHYDTAVVPCLICGAAGPHAWNDAAGVDGQYGTQDDCPHCSAYCAPASISMIAIYRKIPAPGFLQDFIYDAGELAPPPEQPINGQIELHGVGMFHGVGGWPAEVQMAMTWSLGPIIQFDHAPGNPKGPMTSGLLQGFISIGTPVLWLDNGGWPANSTLYPPPTYRTDQGHAKVIGGYDDGGTGADSSDDLCLIYDPWPEYVHMGILPWNCTQGPGGTWNPYWQPLNDVNLADLNDVYLVDTFPAIPEFTTVLVPIIGILAMVVVGSRLRREEEE